VYEAVVRRYASGDREGAVAEMAGWPDDRLRKEIPALNTDWQRSLIKGDALNPSTWRQIPMRAALMLHSDCAQRARRDGKPARTHEHAAWSIARTFRKEPAQSTFARRWYGAMAGLALAENRWGEALDWAERGLEDFPGAADLFLVIGSIEETEGVHAAPPEIREALTDPTTRSLRSDILHRREVRGHLEKARQALRAALAAEPSLHEARLRLGRVAWRLGETAEARAELGEVLARQREGPTAFLAHLFLGRIEEDGGRLDAAVLAYEAALVLSPRSQSARLALSHARLGQGDAAAARAEAEAAVRPAGNRLAPDPFWAYPWGPAVGVEDRLEALRREASS
jgi:tetratricopeptide (TPR) repeat protein